MTKNLNKTGERGVSICTLAKNSKTPKELKKKTLWSWVFSIQVFAEFRGSWLATSNEKPECEKNLSFSMPV